MPAPAAPPYGLADTWQLNNRVNLMLLAHLTDEQLAWATHSRARSIADQFAHLHNVRILWLEPRLPERARRLRKIEKGAATRAALEQALAESADAIAEMLAEAERTGKLKSARRGPLAFLGYALAHEGHHRGQIVVHLKQARMPIDTTFAFSLWEWEKI
jgi:uncharacterized damage-inducible protein DinB